MNSRHFPKRVLMTADTVGGVWTYALELCRALAAHEIEIILATMGARLSESQRHEVGFIPNVKVFESDYKLEWMNEPWSDITRAGDWLLELEDRLQPDVIHLNSFSFGALPWQAPKIVVSHSCVLSWWRAVKGDDAPSDWKTYRDNVTNGLQMADAVVAPSHAMLNALNEHYGPLENSFVIPNGRCIETTDFVRKENFVFSAGRLWDEAKNISALAEVAPQIAWPVCVAGEINHPNGRTAAPGSVKCLGRLSADETVRWLERAAIYALPARYEPFGLSVLEAALCGCALVLGDIPSLRENWDGAALFVPPNDYDELAAALNRLISDSHLLSQLAAQAREVAKQFTPERMAEKYLEVYASVTGETGKQIEKGALSCAS